MKIYIKTSIKKKLLLRNALFGLGFAGIAGIAFFCFEMIGQSENAKAKESNEAAFESKKQVLNVMDNINSDQNFQNSRPLISLNGSELYFCKRTINPNEEIQDIWVASIDESGNLSIPHSLGKTVNKETINGICNVSPDGNEIYLIGSSIGRRAPLYKSKRSNGEWSAPEEVLIEGYSNKNKYVDFHFSYSQKLLFMAVERSNGYGHQDIFFSKMNKDGSFSKPENLGMNVNTYTADFAPFLSEDGTFLFFSSYRPGGLGESDIYVTKRLDNTWKKWSTPINLGESINSSNDECYFSITSDLKFIYFESSNKETTAKNLYKIALPKDLTSTANLASR